MTEKQRMTDNTENSQIQNPVSKVGGSMRQHSGSIVSISRVFKKKFIKITKQLCCMLLDLQNDAALYTV